MTMPPKAVKYRVSRAPQGATQAAPNPAAPDEGLLGPEDDGFMGMSFLGEDAPERAPEAAPRPAAAADAADPAIAEAIAAIRAEGLSAHQLRTAERIAQRRGIAAASALDAVRVLRLAGIDPFARAELVGIAPQPAGAPTGGGNRPAQLPKVVPQKKAPPAAAPMSEGERAREVQQMQRDIVRRRRRAIVALFTRLALLVLLPTILAGYYFYAVATPLYATKSEFLIQQADSPGQASTGSLFGGTQFATAQDSITVQSYLQSRDAMLRLDADQGFKTHFSQDFIDPLQRLDPDATNEAAYRTYQRNVKIGFDPTEGIIKMEVIAADPQVSQRFAEALIGYAEEQVDQLSLRLREDQMKGAREVYDDAEQKLQNAQLRVQELQEKLGVYDPVSESQSVLGQIAALEAEMQQKRLELGQLLDNAKPNQARVEGVNGDISRLEDMIGGLRSGLTQGGDGTNSFAAISGEMRIAEGDLQTRQLMLSQALQQLELARIEANRQVRYLSSGVRPIAPDEATYPRAFENTLLAFLIFAGIYLMLSLTVSILKEQVSA